MSSTTTEPDLSLVKTRQQHTWASGDYTAVAARIVLVSELLADTADLHAGWRVLDVACGNGNATLAAARSGTTAVGVDYVPALLESARERAVTEGLDAEFHTGDAEALPFVEDEFDAVLSVFGSMFAPDHRKTAAEMLRVTRPGGRIALASWTPEGFIGQMFRRISRYLAPPAGVASPLLWGTEKHLADLFGDQIAQAHSTERAYTFRFTSAEDYVAFFRRWYGPTLQAFEALSASDQRSLAADLAALARAHNVHRSGDLAIRATYLETVLTLRG
ncbi:MAG TPA: class I SAM-dependent methyltransferase [Jatrophihabitantaceae bacterium]|jgi:ubiquinone/menaquinone biosynthesis C-methylase UbiE